MKGEVGWDRGYKVSDYGKGFVNIYSRPINETKEATQMGERKTKGVDMLSVQTIHI